MPYLTDDLAHTLPGPEAPQKQKIYWDGDDAGRSGSATKGFALRVTAGGARTWIFAYRARDTGIQRRPRIGAFPKIKAEQARKRAQALAVDVEMGSDPQAERETKRKAARIAELIERFDEEHVSRKRPATQEEYRRVIRLYIKPALGGMRVDDVTTADIEALHRSVSKRGKHQANRVAAVCSKMFALALRWGMRTDGKNPARGIERHREHARQRYPTADEMNRLFAALDAHPDQPSANAIRPADRNSRLCCRLSRILPLPFCPSTFPTHNCLPVW